MFIVEAQRNCGGEIGVNPLWFKRDAMIYFEPHKVGEITFQSDGRRWRYEHHQRPDVGRVRKEPRHSNC